MKKRKFESPEIMAVTFGIDIIETSGEGGGTTKPTEILTSTKSEFIEITDFTN